MSSQEGPHVEKGPDRQPSPFVLMGFAVLAEKLKLQKRPAAPETPADRILDLIGDVEYTSGTPEQLKEFVIFYDDDGSAIDSADSLVNNLKQLSVKVEMISTVYDGSKRRLEYRLENGILQQRLRFRYPDGTLSPSMISDDIEEEELVNFMKDELEPLLKG